MGGRAGRLLAALAAMLAATLPVSGGGAEDMLRYETEDWTFAAPASLGTQADLELNGKQVQLCGDEIEFLTGYRPPQPAKFTVTWEISDARRGSGAGPTGWVNYVPPTWRLVDESSRRFRESLVAGRLCFGPHEVTHVLTWSALSRLQWANEGFAQFTDRLYDSASWRATQPPRPSQTCDQSGYTDQANERHAYTDLSPWKGGAESYNTAACFWIEVLKRVGLPGIRGILAGMRARPPTTTGELVVEHVNRVLNADLRPIMARYGFDESELAASPAPAFAGCTLIGTARGEAITGTPGRDVVCGLAGADSLSGLGGADTLDGGPGDDLLNARDGRPDVVRGGPGRDRARVDRKLDKVTGVERLLP